MPNKKDNQMSGSKGSPGSTPDHEFEGQGHNKGYGGGGQGQKAGGSRQGTGSSMEDDDENTAGGRQGQFSDKERGSGSQWSPGSSQESDR